MSETNLVLTESKPELLGVITLTRSIPDIRIAGKTIYEMIKEKLGVNDVSVITRDYLMDSSKNNNGIIYNSNVIPNHEIVSLFNEYKNDNVIIKYKDDLVFKTSDDGRIIELNSEPIILKYPWDLIKFHDALLADFFKDKQSSHDEYDHSIRLDETKGPVIIEKCVSIDGPCRINGPAYISKDSVIEPFTYIKGNVVISSDCKVVAGAELSNVSVGPVCKVSGQVEDSIFQGYSNKQHTGFLGHSWVGEWVNMGDGTSTSDLKNTYGNFRVRIGSKEYYTKMQFLGSFFGDHSKTAINTSLYGGTSVGIFSMLQFRNVFSGWIPSFTLFKDQGACEFELNKAFEVADRMMVRRNQKLSDSQKKVFTNIFNITKDERKEYIKSGMKNL